MKKQITELLNSQTATLKINEFCRLSRWTRSALGEDVDCLTVTFDLTYSSSHTYNIEARDWRGIVEEVKAAQTAAFAAAAETFNEQLTHGYIG